MTKKIALIDSSSAILLHKAGIFDDLASGYRLIMAESVFRELTVEEHSGAEEFKERSKTGVILIRAVEDDDGIHPPPTPPAGSMGAGERDTIILYYKYPHSFVIIDDKKGARFCRENGIPYVNALLMSRILFISGLLSQERFDPSFESLQRIGRYSAAVLHYAEQCDSDELRFFY
ncbi:MAG: hypothetical protein JXA20_13405 [Spirochaetes bacterium]|nr:hypothetical protein [Spirochaetota bacterium]